MANGLPSWRVARAATAGIVVAFLLVVAEGGTAQAAKRKVGVSLNGPHASSVHEAIAGALKRHHFETISTDLSGDSQDAIAQAAKQGKLAAVMIGEVRDGGKRLKLRVYGSGGDLIGESSWAEAAGIKKLDAVVERTLWARVGGSLKKAHAPGAPAAEKNEEAEEAESEEPASSDSAAEAEKAPSPSRSKEAEPEAAPSSSDEGEPSRKHKKKKKAASDEGEMPEEPTGPAGTALDLAVGPRFVWRNLSWSPATPAGLRGYSLSRAPAFGALIAWYPAAHFRGGWVSNIGVATSIEYTPGLVSQTSDGARYPTTESDYWAGVRGRLIFGAAQAALTLAGGQQSFVFHSGNGAMRGNLSALPDVQYTYARIGVDLRVALPANVSLMLGAGYRFVINAGDQNYLIHTDMYFPNSKFLALDATAGAGYKFLSMLEARVGFDLRRYQMTAGTNTYMVTGGTDQYIALFVQAALLLDGYGAGEGGPSGPSAKAAAPAHADKPAGDDSKGDDE